MEQPAVKTPIVAVESDAVKKKVTIDRAKVNRYMTDILIMKNF